MALDTDLSALPVKAKPAKPVLASPPSLSLDSAAAGIEKAGKDTTAALEAQGAAESRVSALKGKLQQEQGKYLTGLHAQKEHELRALDQGPFQPSENTLGNMAALFSMVGMLGAFMGGSKTSAAAGNAQAALTGMMKGWNTGQDQMVAQQKAIFDENANYLKGKADQIREIYKDYEDDALKVGIPTAQGRFIQRLMTEAEADVPAARAKVAGAQAVQKQAEDILRISEAMENKRATLAAERDRQSSSFAERLMLAQMGQQRGELTPETRDFLSDYYLRTGKIPSMGFGAGGRMQILNAAGAKAKDLGISGADFAAIVSGTASADTALKVLTKQASIMESNERTMLKNMKVVEGLGKPEWANSMPFLNKWAQTGATQFGNENIPPYAAALVTVMDNYAKILSGSTGAAGSTDAARAQAFSVINEYMTTGQVGSIFKVIRQDAANQISSRKSEAQDLKSQIAGKKTLSDDDREALDWANAHPDDPRAAQIKARIGGP